MKRLLPLLALLVFFSCDTQETVIQPNLTEGIQPQASIVDAIDVGGDPTFHWLPPIGPGDPMEFGDFNGDLLEYLSVEICEWAGSTCADDLLARFDMGGVGSRQLRISDEGGIPHFIVNWHLRENGVEGGKVYRIRVFEGPVQIGFANLTPGNGKATVPIKFIVEPRRLPGNPSDNAGGAIEAREYTPIESDFTASDSKLPGFPLSKRILLLSPTPTATVGEINALMTRFGAWVVGGIPGDNANPGLLMFRFPGDLDTRFWEILSEIQAHPGVSTVSPDLLLGEELIFQSDPSPGFPTNSDWDWGLRPAGGNWGLEQLRVPQLWNLNDYVKKSEHPLPEIAVIDGGRASSHDDLAVDEFLTELTSDHATHVLGTIGATQGNGVGVDGILPSARLLSGSGGVCFRFGDFDYRSCSFGKILEFVDGVLDDHPDLLAVNLSLGYNWYKAGIDPGNSPEAQKIANEQGQQFYDILAAKGSSLPHIVAAAGNDSCDPVPSLGACALASVDAVWGSPFTNAALKLGAKNVIVVEAMDWTGARSYFSNHGGHISAPGSDILSTWGTDSYANTSGTSMAAPHITGLLGYMYLLNPDLQRPSLTANPAVDLLLKSSWITRQGGANRPDAFSAALDLETIFGDPVITRALVDVDDGTVDGNTRMVLGSRFIGEDVDADGGPGDGRIDMSDFRRWRDWVLQLEYSQDSRLSLDGGNDHPKFDLNGDGEISDPNKENIFPKGDFNGSGSISSLIRREIRGGILSGEVLSDLGVLQAEFNDPHYSAAELPGLIESGDIHLDLSQCLSFPNVASFRLSARLPGARPTKEWESLSAWHVFTVPVISSSYLLKVELLDTGGKVLLSEEDVAEVGLGSDAYWTPACTPSSAPRLIAHYPLDGDASDDSGNGPDGTVVGATSVSGRPGKPGSGMAFDGADDHISVSYSPELYPTSMTLSLWLRANGPSSDFQTLLTNEGTGVNPPPDPMRVSLEPDGRLKVQFEGDVGPTKYVRLLSPEPISMGVWHHLVASFDETTGDGVMMLDGQVVATANTPMSLVPTDIGLMIGASQNPAGSPYPGRYFSGDLDEIQLFNYALPKEDMRALCDVDVICDPQTFSVEFQDLRVEDPGTLLWIDDQQISNYVWYTGRVVNSDPAPIGDGDTSQEGVVLVRHYLEQGSLVGPAGGGIWKHCTTVLGQLPAGSCDFKIWASNSSLISFGFEPGPATLLAQMILQRPSSSIVLAEARLAITIVDPGSVLSPDVSTRSESNVEQTSFTARGYVNPNGSSAEAWFEWGTNSSLSGASATPRQSVGSGSSTVPFSEDISGLQPDTRYYYRAVAGNALETVYGDVETLRTPGLPGLPDLVPVSMTFPSPADRGETISVTVVTENQGEAPTEVGFRVRVYLSENYTITSSDVEICTTVETATFSGGFGVTTDLTCTIPSDLPEAAWKIGAIVDTEDWITEKSEDNNWDVGGSITIQ